MLSCQVFSITCHRDKKEDVFICRIHLIPTDFPFEFLVKIIFVMTINKSRLLIPTRVLYAFLPYPVLLVVLELDVLAISTANFQTSHITYFNKFRPLKLGVAMPCTRSNNLHFLHNPLVKRMFHCKTVLISSKLRSTIIYPRYSHNLHFFLFHSYNFIQ